MLNFDTNLRPQSKILTPTDLPGVKKGERRMEFSPEYMEKTEKNYMKIHQLMEAGVEFLNVYSVYIDEDVQVGKGTVIGPGVMLQGKTVIGENCTIHQNSRIKDSEIGDGVTIENAVILESKVGEGSNIGPFAYMRPGTVVGKNCKIGDFVETKNTVIGDGTKAPHLSYLGDGDIGSNVNIGCGTVFVNYDGNKKHRSSVGDGAFIGCNSNLVSPVTIEEGAYIAAGSTITKDVPKDSLAVARAKQTNLDGWAARSGLYRKNK